MSALRKRGNKWQARIKRNGYAVEKSFLTKADAQRWARTVEADIERGSFRSNGASCNMTLMVALDKYSHEVTPQKRGASIEYCRIRALKNHPLAQKPLSSIRATDVVAYRDERQQAGKAASTIAKELGLISALFKVAIAEWGMEALSNPVANVKKPKQPPGRDRRLLPGEEEILQQVFKQEESSNARSKIVTNNPWIYPITVIAIETGMRRSEILNLQWTDIDIGNRVARLNKTKNGTSRAVPLTSRAAHTFQQLPRSANGFVFPISTNAFKLAFTRGLKRARLIAQRATPDSKLFLNLTFHDLRHEATSRLAGVFSAHELAKITGHKDLGMVMRYYHPRAEELVHKLS